MDMIDVSSSNIQQIGYDEDTQTLAVVFVNGARYHYSSVPENIFEELKSAGSVGSYFHSAIRDSYDCQKM